MTRFTIKAFIILGIAGLISIKGHAYGTGASGYQDTVRDDTFDPGDDYSGPDEDNNGWGKPHPQPWPQYPAPHYPPHHPYPQPGPQHPGHGGSRLLRTCSAIDVYGSGWRVTQVGTVHEVQRAAIYRCQSRSSFPSSCRVYGCSRP